MINYLNLYFLLQIILGVQVEYTFIVKDEFALSKREIVKIDLSKNEVLDIKFYSSYFPDIISNHFLPREFMKLKSSEYSDTTIVYNSSGKIISSYDELDEDYYYNNWTYKSKYNNKSQLIYYTYSGCEYCSTSVYHIYVLYDNSGRVKTLENIINNNFRYVFFYSDKKNINEVKTFHYGFNLNQKIKLRKNIFRFQKN
ncbi:MAG: hypothetical protein ACPG5B_13335 [Chitinophagales bacterium]